MMQRRRSCYGWGLADYQLPADELAWFEARLDPLHSFGRSVHDLAHMIHWRDFSNPPDVVCLPENGTGRC
jgi:hypothetical protein